jgi:transposase
VRRSDKQIRALLRDSLAHALEATHTSQSGAAKRMKVHASTVRRWLSTDPREEAPVDVAKVLRSRVLSPHFVRCLALSERKTRTGGR